MKSYLALAPKYLASHGKKTKLSISSIVISVALVAGIFSMLDVFLQFEKIQVIHDYGNYHLSLKDATEEETQAIAGRIEVKNAGTFIGFGKVTVNGISCQLGALDENFAGNLNIRLIEGRYPAREDEILIEGWASESRYLNVRPGGTVTIAFPDGTTRKFTVSGIGGDWAVMKAAGVPGVFVSMDYARFRPARLRLLLIECKDRVDIQRFKREIASILNIAPDRLGQNEPLLAVIGQSDHKAAVGLYQVGAILFTIVLVAGVVMIYNTFNISVLERVRQFGLLRCVGASKAQIGKLVKREGLILAARALPLGVPLGVVMTFVCCAILKFYNSHLFAEIPLFYLSPTGILAGVAVGLLTVFLATLLPAKKAARVSPVNAVTGSSEIGVPKAKKQGLLTRLLPTEIAMGINNAVMKKKTLVLLSASIALSIIMFLGFNVFVDFLYASLKTTKPYTPDISLVSEEGLDRRLYEELARLDGVKHVYGRMFGYVDATFDASRLSETYKREMGGIETDENGLFVAPENSWLISYDPIQLKWAKIDLLEGTLSADSLNERNGIVAVARTVRNGISVETANLRLGDKVYIKTITGTKVFTVMAILRSVPFSDAGPNLATFITTEKLFTKILGRSPLKVIDIQLKRGNQAQTIAKIKKMSGEEIKFLDSRQKNREINQTFLTMAVFVYGFVAVIALISILNIINTMNTSVVAKTKYLGVMRAVGMSGRQLDRMIAAEAATYGFSGCIIGCVLGVLLQRALITNSLTAIRIAWRFPFVQVVCTIILTMLTTWLSVVGPLKRIKARGISETIESLQ
ncbi:MAG: ABC transporter permease [Firmicutes bacterium]|nr:ABC transporter permease [Bacillota bacterium]